MSDAELEVITGRARETGQDFVVFGAGPFTVAVTGTGRVITRIHAIPRPHGDSAGNANPLLDRVRRYLETYFNDPGEFFSGYRRGRWKVIPVSEIPGSGKLPGQAIPVDVSGATIRERAVYGALLSVPPGETITYAGLAERAGVPRAWRFTGTVMAKNPFPLLVPCHRVIRSDGATGNYGPGQGLKVYLLEHERCMTVAGRR